MRIVTMHEAKSSLSRLVAAVKSGAEPEIIIAIGKSPAARLVPYTKPERSLGMDDGTFTIPTDFDERSPDIEALFGG